MDRRSLERIVECTFGDLSFSSGACAMAVGNCDVGCCRHGIRAVREIKEGRAVT